MSAIVTVNGKPLGDVSGSPLNIEVVLDGDQILLPVNVTVTGGTLTVKRSEVTATGVNLEMFGEEEDAK